MLIYNNLTVQNVQVQNVHSVHYKDEAGGIIF
jgi:hypothetical protein